jgi:O-antigen/teichoic acid export membrane protein
LYPVEALFVDQLVIALFLTPYDLGLYVVAIAFAAPPRLGALAIALICLPAVASALPERRALVTRRYVLLVVALSGGIAVLLAVSVPTLLPIFFGGEFSPAIVPAQVLLGSSAIYGIKQVIGESLKGAGKPGTVSLIETASWPLVVAALGVGHPRVSSASQWEWWRFSSQCWVAI